MAASKYNRTKRFDDFDATTVSNTYDGECSIDGCWLPASIVTAWHETGSPKRGQCCYHHAQHSAHVQTITSNLRGIRRLVDAVRALRAAPVLDVREMAPQTIQGIKQSRPETDETMSAWLSRMERVIATTATSGLRRQAQTTRRRTLRDILMSVGS